MSFASRGQRNARPAARHRIPLAVQLALVAMALPITVGSIAGVELTPADFAAPWLLLTFAFAPKGIKDLWRGASLTLALGVVAVSIALISMLSNNAAPAGTGIVQEFGALIFSFRPLAFLVLGYLLATRVWAQSSKITMILGGTASFSTIAVTASLVLSGVPHHQYGPVPHAGTVAYGEHLSGSLLGLPLYARYGVNSLAETYAVYGSLALAALVIHVSSRTLSTVRDLLTRLWLIGGCLAAMYLCITSLSRQAQFAIGLCFALVGSIWVLRKFFRAKHGTALLLTLLGAVITAVAASQGLQADIAAAGGLDAYSAGRIQIFQNALRTLSENFLVGNGFSTTESLNAHNLVLNLTLKIGFLGAVAYLGSLLVPTVPALRRLVEGRNSGGVLVADLTWGILVVAVGAISNALDVITASGPLLLLLGLHAHLSSNAGRLKKGTVASEH